MVTLLLALALQAPSSQPVRITLGAQHETIHIKAKPRDPKLPRPWLDDRCLHPACKPKKK